MMDGQILQKNMGLKRSTGEDLTLSAKHNRKKYRRERKG
jgi:hypothetical protein